MISISAASINWYNAHLWYKLQGTVVTTYISKMLLNISRSIKFISHGQKFVNFLQVQFELTFQKFFSSHLFASEASRCLDWNAKCCRASYGRGSGAQPPKISRFFTRKILWRCNFAIETCMYLNNLYIICI